MFNSKEHAKWLRWFRWLHRKVSIALFVFFVVMALTGILLGWKKATGILAPTQQGTSANPGEWLPVDSLSKLANRYLADSVSASLSTKLDRIDIRPAKGIAKFVFAEHYWGLQLDCTSGQLLSVEQRGSDFLEDLHDGSLFDSILQTGGEGMKLGYTAIMGLSLLLLTLTGFWLWYGPKRIRRLKKNAGSRNTVAHRHE